MLKIIKYSVVYFLTLDNKKRRGGFLLVRSKLLRSKSLKVIHSIGFRRILGEIS